MNVFGYAEKVDCEQSKSKLRNLENEIAKLAKFVSFNNPDGERKEAIHNGHEST